MIRYRRGSWGIRARIPKVALVVVMAVGVLGQTATRASAAGTFYPIPVYFPGGGYGALVAADFNGDGKKDAAVSGLNRLNVYFKTGPSQFTLSGQYGGATSGSSLVTADLNGDGMSDIVGSGQRVAVFIASGGGSFKPAVGYQTQSESSGVAVVDLNHDGRRDVIATNTASNSLSVLLGQGDGTFLPATTTAAGSGPFSVKAVNLNHDNNWDLLVTNSGSDTMSLFIGRGNGTFNAPINYKAGANPSRFVLAELNGDDLVDVIVASASTVSVVPGDRTYGLGRPVTYSVPGYFTPYPFPSVAVGDFQNDGKLDLLANGQILPGRADGTFAAPVEISRIMGGASLQDWNRDGTLDILATNGGLALFQNRTQTVSSSPASGVRGTFVTATGTTFLRGEVVDVKYKTGLASPQPTVITICSAGANNNGNFVCSGYLPNGPQAGSNGAHVIVAKGRSSFARATTTFMLTN